MSQPGAVCPRTPEDIFLKKNGRVFLALRLTRWGMVWERAARAFWPLAGLLACLFAAFAFGGVAAVPSAVLPWLAGVALAALLAAAIWGGLRYRRVGEAEAIGRLDRTMPGRPLAALRDRAAIGGEGALWQAHLVQMQLRAAEARAVRPDADLARRDPFALRLASLVALVMALLFGGAAQMGQGISAIAATINRPLAESEAGADGPGWEGWAEPPAYTRRPTIYLNALPEGEMLELPKGSVVSFRLYAETTNLTHDIGPEQGEDARAPEIRAEQSGMIEVSGRRFDVTVLPDRPPVIRAGSVEARRADGRMVQPFEAEDDHGIVSANARIELDLPQVTRQFGLAVAPEPREALSLDLPLPRSGNRSDVQGRLVEDLSRHPWANMPVKLTLRAIDGIDQEGQAAPTQLVLPGRRFFDPLAAALIELRRDLLWSRQNAGRSAEILRAVTWQPEGFVEEPLYLQLRGAVRMLESDSLSEEARDKLAEALWKAAVLIEDGGLTDALERMKQAQEKLSEAIRNGASPDEIQRLMNELKEATDAYTQMLAEQGKEDPSERFTQNQQRQEITGDQIQQMMDEIQRLMNEGRMAEAQQLLEQFNRMMENLQVTQGQGGEGRQGSGQGNQSMNGLADTLREQQRLSDEAFREMQEQFGQGELGNTPENADELARRQRELREELGQQRGLLPGQGSEPGDDARQRLDDAGRAMEDAEQALRDGDLGGALQRQADAIQSMREGMRALGDLLGQDGQRRRAGDDREGQQDQPGQPSGPSGEQDRQSGSATPRDGRPMLDPLGRQQPGNGNVITSGDPLSEGTDPAARARDLLDEIRRRSGERERSQDERDYLGRLLDRF
ncbi:DUF4175 domain-containing protein [Paracoccus saliphilus]|uniref:TIGR02302 family protein n=2 Tax=Paracoccus saliphilus TaxID=405559 RepID=A0AA45W6T4_9RHOB|nr:DUF4175 family protein [Paracoccus saliphilus]SIT03725.1 TIGR02302 family protein [Paracoccus saliphilus]